MRKKCSVCLFVFALLLSCLSGKSAYAATSSTIAKHVGNSNPLIDHHLGADPIALTYNGRVYIYIFICQVMTMNIIATERLKIIHLPI
ncbi:Non-reducing end alpha-L-arabinofuranosidase [Bacillus subtilis subsp. subtilis]|nr:Non-reducing end alpha-L-arabinofuranosidase [Bacillus subtilis]ARV98867.1 Non-reducing end alpha-L-arabinofuranosidase [Bacillus subtilis subsp. subtilis]ARW02941.1 Non-reducing end alpha-L-arabinofuranosidase [Bacillus subtilis subsp. subtilis]ARW31657.1 Non-reducing end alpha-L-arabinofuranosidase [Bacillus subtilis subsp. subtilis]ASB57349.1 Non-reducing end alpha-L-arabinofuranosidase [Bacillus subtilis subsp. subtilis]